MIISEGIQNRNKRIKYCAQIEINNVFTLATKLYLFKKYSSRVFCLVAALILRVKF